MLFEKSEPKHKELGGWNTMKTVSSCIFSRFFFLLCKMNPDHSSCHCQLQFNLQLWQRVSSGRARASFWRLKWGLKTHSTSYFRALRILSGSFAANVCVNDLSLGKRLDVLHVNGTKFQAEKPVFIWLWRDLYHYTHVERTSGKMVNGQHQSKSVHEIQEKTHDVIPMNTRLFCVKLRLNGLG